MTVWKEEGEAKEGFNIVVNVEEEMLRQVTRCPSIPWSVLSPGCR